MTAVAPVAVMEKGTATLSATSRIAPQGGLRKRLGGRPPGTYLPFSEARRKVREAKLRSEQEFFRWMKENRSTCKTRGVPYHPDRIYVDQGWRGFRDWVGYTSRRPLKPRTQDGKPIRYCRDPSKVHKYAQRLRAINFVCDGLMSAEPAEKPAEQQIIDVCVLPLCSSATMLFRVRDNDGDSGDKCPKWLPIAVRSAGGRFSSDNADHEAAENKIKEDSSTSSSTAAARDHTMLQVTGGSSSVVTFWRCDFCESSPLFGMPLIGVVSEPRRRDVVLARCLDGKRRIMPEEFRPVGAVEELTTQDTRYTGNVKDFLLAYWLTVSSERRKSFAEWIACLTSQWTRDASLYRGIAHIVQHLFEPLGLLFSFCPHRQRDDSFFNAELGPHRVFVRKAGEIYRVPEAKRGFRVKMESGRCPDGLVFSGPTANAHTFDFLITFSGSERTDDRSNGLFIVPNEVLLQNIQIEQDSFYPWLTFYPPNIETRFVHASVSQKWQEPFYIDLSDVEKDPLKAREAIEKARIILAQYGKAKAKAPP
ncbi:unnamed protein product [Amoebophrya sp. A120]|nr:unnamed protein product [Amoebophrya sp. A120]|eukprot:GSA120T00010103001.1